MHYSPLKEHAPLYFNRNQQINEVQATFPGCKATSSDRSRLEIPFKLSDGVSNAVIVTLPGQFPTKPPSLAVAAHITHPWVDTASNLSVPCIDYWGSSDVSLATAVRDFLSSLATLPHVTTSPPRRSPAAGHRSGTPNPMRLPFFGGGQNNNGDRSDRPGSSQNLQGQNNGGGLLAGPLQIPPPSMFPQLATMTTADLERAVLDQVSFEKLLAKVAADPQASAGGTAMTEAAALRRSNLELARNNLSKEGEMEEIRRQIAIVKSTEYDAAKAAFDEKSKRQDAARQVLAPERLIERLHEASITSLNTAAGVEKQLFAGQIQATEFVEQYTAARVQYHSLDMKYQAAVQTIPSSGNPPGQATSTQV